MVARGAARAGSLPGRPGPGLRHRARRRRCQSPQARPDLYLHAVELLDVEAQATVAFEDSAPGVASARAAGLHVVAVGTEDEGWLGAHERVDSLEDPLVGERLGLDESRVG